MSDSPDSASLVSFTLYYAVCHLILAFFFFFVLDNPDEIGCIIEEAAAALPEGKIGAKKLRKLEEKAERAARAEVC